MTIVRDVGVVIVAGGQGTRTGQAELKQFRWVAGKPMLLHSLQAFHAREDVAVVVCVIPRAYVGDPPPWILQCDVDRLLVSVGGDTRSDSVMNGLEDMPPEVHYILVQDAAHRRLPHPQVLGAVDAADLGLGDGGETLLSLRRAQVVVVLRHQRFGSKRRGSLRAAEAGRVVRGGEKDGGHDEATAGTGA